MAVLGKENLAVRAEAQMKQQRLLGITILAIPYVGIIGYGLWVDPHFTLLALGITAAILVWFVGGILLCCE